VTAYHYYVPRPPLSAFVEVLWSCEGDTPTQTTERRLPDGSMEVVITLCDDLIRIYDRRRPDRVYKYHGGVISGAQAEFTLIDTTVHAGAVGVHFKPGGAAPFLPAPAGALHDAVIPLDVLWGAAATDLREQMLEAKTVENKFHILEQFLLARLAPTPAAYPAVAFALAAFHDVSRRAPIAAVVEQIGLSQTRFIQVFRDTVGLTPKQFCRIQRFQQVLRLLDSGGPVRWVDLALACGYCDQAHFIHEFRAFTGLTPSAYLIVRGPQRNHIALPR